MKKLLALVIALMMVMALSVTVFADTTVYVHEFVDPVDTDGGWWSNPADFSNDADFVAALQTEGAVLVIVADADAANGFQFGFQAQGGSWSSGLIHSNFANGEGVIGADVAVEGDRATITVDAPAFYAASVAAITAAGDSLDTWQWVNGQNTGKAYSVSVVVPDAPATNEAPATTDTPAAPSTGLALAVVPAVMALAAVAVSKKH